VPRCGTAATVRSCEGRIYGNLVCTVITEDRMMANTVHIRVSLAVLGMTGCGGVA